MRFLTSSAKYTVDFEWIHQNDEPDMIGRVSPETIRIEYDGECPEELVTVRIEGTDQDTHEVRELSFSYEYGNCAIYSDEDAKQPPAWLAHMVEKFRPAACEWVEEVDTSEFAVVAG